jgi:hypothetical protein
MKIDTDRQNQVIQETQLWLEKAVIGLNLCPFAKSVYLKNQIRYRVSEAETKEVLLQDLISELEFIAKTPTAEVDTTLLIHPKVLDDFFDYNAFLQVADKALRQLGLESVIQIASFHPQYQFADTEADDIENYTNRSPYPILHLLREESVSKAVDSVTDAEAIPEKNIETMKKLGHIGWKKLGLPG